MSELADVFDLSFDTVADTPALDASTTSSILDESAGLDMTPQFGDVTPQVPDIPSVPETPPPVEAAPPPPAAPPPEPPPQPAASPSPGAFDQDTSKGVFDNRGSPLTGPASSPAPQGVLNGAATWFKNLTPGAQAILAGGVAGGAGAVMQGLQQQHMIEYQKERDQKERDFQTERENVRREDIKRRGHVDAFGPTAFKPKGIIDASRGG